MKKEQIQKYAALISKYENRKKGSRLATQPRDMSNCSHTLDNSLFKQVIQQKIKNKYNDPDESHQPPLPPSLHERSDPKNQQNALSYGLDCRERQQRISFPRQTPLPKANNLTIDKSKTPIFINTSYLLSVGSPSFLKSRKEPKLIQVAEEKQRGWLRAEGVGKKWKKSLERRQRLERMVKYGYELDGSIFHFEHAKTQPSEPEDSREQEISRAKAERERIYQLLKSTSPLVVTPKIPKTSSSKAKTLPHEEVLWPRLPRKKNPKSSSQKRSQIDCQLKAASMQIKKSDNCLPKEAITAWDYEEDL